MLRQVIAIVLRAETRRSPHPCASSSTTASRAPPRLDGYLTLDEGAVEALARRGKSLLASGILAVSGSFDAGDPVSCTDRDGKEFAKGLVNFSSDLLDQIKGLKSTEIHLRIGPQEYEEVIHRDNLVILLS